MCRTLASDHFSHHISQYCSFWVNVSGLQDVEDFLGRFNGCFELYNSISIKNSRHCSSYAASLNDIKLVYFYTLILKLKTCLTVIMCMYLALYMACTVTYPCNWKKLSKILSKFCLPPCPHPSFALPFLQTVNCKLICFSFSNSILSYLIIVTVMSSQLQTLVIL